MKTRKATKQEQELIIRHISSYPEKMQQKMYVGYELGKLADLIDDDNHMGWGIKIRLPKIRIKSIGRFVSGLAKSLVKVVGDIANESIKVVGGVVSLAERTYQDVKSAVVQVMPPFLRPYVGIALAPLELVVAPKATIANLSDDLTEVAKDIRTGVVGQVTTQIYNEAARPAFRVVRNVINETTIKPALFVVDKSAAALLPKSIRDKLEEITDVPALAGRGKLTDKEVLQGMKASVQLSMIPSKTIANFSNDVVNQLKKDAILGPFLEGFDKYSGGLLTSAQNLASTPDEIYDGKNINWKQKIIDGIKIYLATVGVRTIITSMTSNYIGTETGLSNTPLGRAALSAGVAYGGSFYDSGSMTAALPAAERAVLSSAKGEVVKESIKKGYVADKYMANALLSAGGKFYGSIGTDKTLMTTMGEVYDGEFQDLADRELKKQTGVPLKYSHLVDIYNTDWNGLYENVADAMKKLAPTMGTSDGNFLAKMGQSLVDEIKRVPENFPKITDNILNELQRSPENLAKFASNVVNEAQRTPENIVNIAGNIATESARAAQNVAQEIVRTPDNVAQTAENIIREGSQAVTNVANEIDRIDPSVSIKPPSLSVGVPSVPDLDSLIQKYGPTVIALLQERHPGWMPSMPIDSSMMETIELNYNQKKGIGGLGLLAGILGLAALGYVASQE